MAELSGLKTLMTFASLLEKKVLKEDDFLKAFKLVMDAVNKRDEAFKQATKILTDSIKGLENKLESNNSVSVSDMKKEISKALSKANKEQSNGLNFLRDKVRGLRNGNDVDESRVIESVISKIKLSEQKETILDSPTEIANKLESLPEDQKLAISATKGLKEALKEMKDRPLGRAGSVQPFIFRTIKNHVPTETPNGSITAFSVPKVPKTDTEQVFLNGVRQRSGSSNDYTVAGKTITFNTAPLTDEVILIDLEYV